MDVTILQLARSDACAYYICGQNHPDIQFRFLSAFVVKRYCHYATCIYNVRYTKSRRVLDQDPTQNLWGNTGNPVCLCVSHIQCTLFWSQSIFFADPHTLVVVTDQMLPTSPHLWNPMT